LFFLQLFFLILGAVGPFLGSSKKKEQKKLFLQKNEVLHVQKII